MSNLAKAKEIGRVAEMLKGRRVRIYKTIVGPLLTGEITACTLSGIELKDVEWWTGTKYDKYYLSIIGISKIEPE